MVNIEQCPEMVLQYARFEAAIALSTIDHSPHPTIPDSVCGNTAATWCCLNSIEAWPKCRTRRGARPVSHKRCNRPRLNLDNHEGTENG